MLSVAPWFGTGLTFFRELCYLTVVAFQRQGIYEFIYLNYMFSTMLIPNLNSNSIVFLNYSIFISLKKKKAQCR